jgi:ankyrin repeat/SOCS box protein 2
MTDYNDIGGEVRPEELGASWIGSGERPDVNSSTGDETDLYPQMPPGPLHAAVARDDIAAIERLVAEGADVNAIPHGYTVTALGFAASQATAATVRKLVALGADLHKRGREGATPLRLAVQSGQVEKIRTLVDLGANIDEYDTQIGTLLHVAVTMQVSPDIIHLLLEVGVDAERKNAAGFTALHAVQSQLAGLRQLQGMLMGVAVPTMTDQINALESIERILSP